jgi:hypothetical protein
MIHPRQHLKPSFRELAILIGWICSTPRTSANATTVSPLFEARTSRYTLEKFTR